MKEIVVKINRSENHDKYWKGYAEGDPLEAALTIEVYNAGLVTPDDPDETLLACVFAALNDDRFVPVGNLTERQVREYHNNYPSLSVGDVVEINNQPYACETTGWRKLPRPEHEWVWLDAAEVAKIVRTILRESFPDTKFSVRTSKYAGGASIDVDWWDGPRQSDVDSQIKYLQSVSHMDITDLVHHKKTVHNGKAFHSGAHYIFSHRHYSKGFYERIAAKVISDYGLNIKAKIVESSFGAHLTGDDAQRNMNTNGLYMSLDDMVRKAASERPSMGFNFKDEPDTFEWTDSEGNRVTSTYSHGVVKSKWNGGKNREYVNSDEWLGFKVDQGLNALADEEEKMQEAFFDEDKRGGY